jgi:putative phage-type endonuclease
MDQRTESWFAMRAGKLTGSRFSDVMNVIAGGKPGANRRALIASLAVERLTGQCVETFCNDAMRRGTELEPEARAAYEAHVGALCEEVAFIPHPSLDYVGVSPDGLVGPDGMVELKCPANMAKHMDALLRGEHATEYRWQLQGQLWVAERAWVDATSYDPRYPEHLRLAITRVQRDEDAIEQLAAECAKVNDEINRALDALNNLERAA